MLDPDSIAANAAHDFAQALAPRWSAQLGSNLLGVYLLGSLAHGGFSRRYSDIDIAAVTATLLAPAELEPMRAAARDISPEFAPKLSIFFTDRGFAAGRFPPLDRADYLDHAVTLVEREHVAPPQPTLNDVRVYLAGVPFSNWAKNSKAFAGAETLQPAERKSYLRALLYPARFLYSYLTGRMASNDDAVAFVAERPPPGLDVRLLQQALACRRAAADPDDLFAARGLLPRQVTACEHFLRDYAYEAG